MRTALALGTAAALALAAVPALADTDLTGSWAASYTAVSPTNSRGEGPRFNQAEWQLTITEQQGNVFYGQTKWRTVNSPDWTTLQVTGNISADGSGRIGIVEIGTEEPYDVHSVIDGLLDGDRIYVDYRSIRSGATYSAVLEKSEAN